MVGALIIAYGAGLTVRANREYNTGASSIAHRREKYAYLIGSLLIALGFLLLFISSITRTGT
jgi:hypothetical protein